MSSLLLLLLLLSFNACHGRLFIVETDHIQESNKDVMVMHVISENPENKTTSIKAMKRMKTPSNAALVDTANGTVSWSVPRTGKKKTLYHHHQHHPGFNVDYAVPRTHPPSHN